MKVLKKILWAVDFNQDHELSTSNLIKSSEIFGNEIVLLNVLPSKLKSSSFKDIVTKSIEDELQGLKQELTSKTDIKVIIRIEFGSIVEKILEVAEDENVNGIILNQGNGKEGKHNNLGTNAFNTILNSRKPVNILTNTDINAGAGIACSVDFSEPSGQALKNAIIHAKKLNQKLLIFSVFTPLSITSPRLLSLGLDTEVENAEMFKKFETNFNNFLKEFNFLDIEFEKKTIKGEAAAEIIKVAKNAHTLYIGSTGKTGLKRVVLGSITEKVIQEVPCNIVITKSEDVFKIRIPSDINDVNNHFSTAQQLQEIGYLDDAVTHYKACLDLNSMHIPSVLALSKLYDKQGETKRSTYYTELYNQIMEQFNNWKIEEEIRKSNRS